MNTRYFIKTLTVLCLCLLVLGFGSKAQNLKDSISASQNVIKDSIISIQNLDNHEDTTQVNDVIAIRIKTNKNGTAFNTLYIDGIKLKGVKPWKQSDCDNFGVVTVFFKLDDQFYDLVNSFSANEAASSRIIVCDISIGNQETCLVQYSQPFLFEIKQRISFVGILIISILCIAISVLALWKDILKDDNNLYYSLGRTQLFYWTLLFVISYLYVCDTTGTLPDLPTSILTILGISVGTTAMSKVIENKNKDAKPIAVTAASEGWFLDILSDGTSINIQRFQNVIFNIVFGVIFIQRTICFKLIPDFDENVLLLLGISSFTYAGLKVTESTKEQNQPLPQVNSDPITNQSPSAPADTNPSPENPPTENPS